MREGCAISHFHCIIPAFFSPFGACPACVSTYSRRHHSVLVHAPGVSSPLRPSDERYVLYLVIFLGRRLICKPGSRLLVLDDDDYLDFQKLHADEQKRHACFPVYPELVLEFIPPPPFDQSDPFESRGLSLYFSPPVRDFSTPGNKQSAGYLSSNASLHHYPFIALMGIFQRFSTKVRNRKSILASPTTTSVIADKSSAAEESAATAMASDITVPNTQKILLLYGPRQPYKVVENYAVPKLLSDDEVLVRTRTIGLNPIDWKAP